MKPVFKNKQLSDNQIEKAVWRSLSIEERLEKALSWGREIDYIQEKIFGKRIKFLRLKEELEQEYRLNNANI
jgi:DNA primase large subunit